MESAGGGGGSKFTNCLKQNSPNYFPLYASTLSINIIEGLICNYLAQVELKVDRINIFNKVSIGSLIKLSGFKNKFCLLTTACTYNVRTTAYLVNALFKIQKCEFRTFPEAGSSLYTH